MDGECNMLEPEGGRHVQGDRSINGKLNNLGLNSHSILLPGQLFSLERSYLS